jgi:hypothetical protein
MKIIADLGTHVFDGTVDEMKEDHRRSICAKLFGELVKLTSGTVEHYVSDLYHDAQWINKHIGGVCEFYYSFDNWGTAIGANMEDVQAMRADNLHKVSVVVERYSWKAIIERADVGDAYMPGERASMLLESHRDAVWEIMNDLIDTFRKALSSGGGTDIQCASVMAEVNDYVSRIYGD